VVRALAQILAVWAPIARGKGSMSSGACLGLKRQSDQQQIGGTAKMRKLVESTFVTLDAVISSPEKWGAPYRNDEHNKYAHDLLFAADALLLGRKTYEGFAEAWPSRTGDDYSDRINSLPKYVSSTTLKETKWNATLVQGDVAGEVAELKRASGRDILKFGTGELDHTLMQHHLIDEFHFWLFPVAVGNGQRLFDGIDPTHLKLVKTTTFSTGIVVLTYIPKQHSST
jgi:dihydrofolate reductase